MTLKNRDGITVINPIYSFTGNFFYEGLCEASPLNSDSMGYIDTTGKFVISPIYTVAYPFGCGVAVVGTGIFNHGKRFIINKNGKLISNKKWLRSATNIGKFNDNMAVIGFNKSVWNFIKDKIY